MMNVRHVQSLHKARTEKHCIFPTKILFLLIIGFGYLAIGGALFEYLEKPSELEATQKYHDLINETFVNNNLTSEQQQAIRDLMNQLADLRPFTGVIGKTDWSFSGAVYYSLTVVTTIGYGWISCQTLEGQIVTIVYAIFGIPLIFYLFAYVGRKLIESAAGHISRFRKDNTARRTSVVDENKVLLPLLAALVVVLAALCIMAAAYAPTQGWSYFQSFYFSFITTSTIGFGDIVPDFDHRGIYVVVQVLAVFLMLSLYSYLLNLCIRVLNNFHDWLTTVMLRRMDIKGNRHVGPKEIVFFCFGQTSKARARHQAALLETVFESDDVEDKRTILNQWADFALNHNVCRRPAKHLQVFAVLGGPGSGKSAMAQNLAQTYDIHIIDLEELIIQEIASARKLGKVGSPRGKAMHAVLASGGNLPNEVCLELLNEAMLKLPKHAKVLLDGFPWDKKIAELFFQHVSKIEKVFYLECSSATLRKRFKFDLSPSTALRHLLSLPSTLSIQNESDWDLNDFGDEEEQLGFNRSSSAPMRKTSLSLLNSYIDIREHELQVSQQANPQNAARGLRRFSSELMRPQRRQSPPELKPPPPVKVDAEHFDETFQELLNQHLLHKQALLEYLAPCLHLIDGDGDEDTVYDLLQEAYESELPSNLDTSSVSPEPRISKAWMDRETSPEQPAHSRARSISNPPAPRVSGTAPHRTRSSIN